MKKIFAISLAIGSILISCKKDEPIPATTSQVRSVYNWIGTYAGTIVEFDSTALDFSKRVKDTIVVSTGNNDSLVFTNRNYILHYKGTGDVISVQLDSASKNVSFTYNLKQYNLYVADSVNAYNPIFYLGNNGMSSAYYIKKSSQSNFNGAVRMAGTYIKL